MKLPIPVNILTGALGVGKTTAVTQLLRQKPPNEKWALLVNEFGALGIDAALVEAGIGVSAAEGPTGAAPQAPSGAAPNPLSTASLGIVVRELAGGCLCCTLSGPLGVAIAQLVRQAKPDRLIIEPSGLGHPAGLLDTLYGEHLRSALDVKAVICLVDVRAAAEEELAAAGAGPHRPLHAAPGSTGPDPPREGPHTDISRQFRQLANVPFLPPFLPLGAYLNIRLSFSHTHCFPQDQVNVADVLVGHKADLATPDQLSAFWRWAEQLYPPKAQMRQTTLRQNKIKPALSSLSGHLARPKPRRAGTQARTQPYYASSGEQSRQHRLGPVGPAPGTCVQLPFPAASAVAPSETTAEGATSSGKLKAVDPAEGYSIGAAAAAGEGGSSDKASVAPVLQLLPGRPLRFPSSPSGVLRLGAPPPWLPSQPPAPAPQQAQQQLVEGVEDAEAVGDEAGLAGRRELSCGWLFSSEDVFDRSRLVEVLGELWGSAARLKGIFRRESRLEVIVRTDDGGTGGSAATATEAAADSAVAAAELAPGGGGSNCSGRGGGDAGSGGDVAAVVPVAAACLGLGEALKATDWDAVERALMAALKLGP
ncbi:hypothetical protein VOLCADRAFT_95390 [Volvox carteri f. nagariensis]|uniref:CobW/HypB/UreG nucleotide-binding domain-containing protein n=1 Tax=Volvox carteri f. nagariensis TaxID=3068 RepID=D8U7B3_VOLCA|nr:uncharacterized protein VOLCADRAFT_95390 [Volvox carteri f. nagariensis]EFJ44456.1 hypothetical protein VOLCADRAFT_95390 [Volvox carteri f. nagariensis]|eukprot:XP_002954563.1 hypothetical protein VOLCADRAFT_95390 [Volvox carteri f. nagariensis]